MSQQYEKLRQGAGFTVLPPRTLIELTGSDRHAFLHNFCTADVKALAVGKATELFVLNGKGKVLSFGQLLALPNRLLLTEAQAHAPDLISHLDMYLLRDDVQLTDLSVDGCAFFVCGTGTAGFANVLPEIPSQGEAKEVRLGEHDCVIANVEIAGDGLLILTSNNAQADLTALLVESGLIECSLEAIHAVRIANRTPWSGIDVTEDNLPQELRRDEQAISFTKGCYLGQETVARIDARGHVNKLLVGLEFESGSSPTRGMELNFEEKKIGYVTSLAINPVTSKPIGLGYVRRSQAPPGTVLDSEAGPVIVRE